jgi:hypothetical protein
MIGGTVRRDIFEMDPDREDYIGRMETLPDNRCFYCE